MGWQKEVCALSLQGVAGWHLVGAGDTCQNAEDRFKPLGLARDDRSGPSQSGNYMP